MIIISVGLVHAQYGVLLLDTAATNTAGKVIFKYAKDANPVPVKLTGSATITATGMSTTANQKLLYTIDSLVQVNTRKIADSTAILRAIVNKLTSNPSTSIRQDSLLALIKLIYGREYSLLINQTNGNQLFTPYLSYIRSSYTFKAASDTATYNFNNNYLKCYVTVYDSSATADTLIFESYSYAKLGYTTQMIGFKDVATDLIEADNTTVVVAGTNAKEWVINRFRPGLVRVRPKSLAGRSAFKTKRVVFVGVN